MKKLQPHEAMLVQRVHARIVSEAWFNGNAVTETELLKIILRHHADDVSDESALMALCLGEARARFSRRRDR